MQQIQKATPLKLRVGKILQTSRLPRTFQANSANFNTVFPQNKISVPTAGLNEAFTNESQYIKV